MNIIEVNDLSKSFGNKNVVNGITMKVNKGEIYGFLGRNGAGKSTFINMLTGIINPSSGSFSLLGEDKIDRVKNRIGVLPDYSSFYDSMTAYNHLRFFSRIQGFNPTKEIIEHTLETVGLEKAKKKKLSQFSFGMKKKLGIAQAIINEPELLFLDEPTSGVDVESAIQIKELIDKLNKNGQTIFMTSHNLNEVEDICTKIGIMKNGEIHSEGTLRELKTTYQSSLTAQIKVGPAINKHARQEIDQFLNNEFQQFDWEDNRLIVNIQEEDDIPVLIRMLINKKIDIYSVHLIEPTLEEVFLERDVAI
ncbi:ATP-binding cassette domain-containing protein [Halobacillus litoralis]|uniref:ATP-binding cassette domain-containing protein n=1 Tax=Halobacillus litoralis TaxID=45668 RepID=A0A845FGX0_9BACI|nr:ABC transporter ATP-binding protein [Halobacillus litoralis]MYL73059.1 ATP-binding cassette domain-containing protein [Halobacillus litoralis]